MTAVAAASGGPDKSAALYEELRDRVLGGAASGGQVGLAVLLREGMTAWLARADRVPAPPPSSVRQPAAATGSRTIDEPHASIVRVLASMALAGRTEQRV